VVFATFVCENVKHPSNVQYTALSLPAMSTATRSHWRLPRPGCRGHIPQYFGWGDVNGNIPPILLRTFGYSRPILVALRSLSLKPVWGGVFPSNTSPHSVVRPPNLELALTPLPEADIRLSVAYHIGLQCFDAVVDAVGWAAGRASGL